MKSTGGFSGVALSGGLNRNQQTDIMQRLLPQLMPKPGKKPQRVKQQSAAGNVAFRSQYGTDPCIESCPVGRCAPEAGQGIRL